MARYKDCDKCHHRFACAGDTDKWNYFGECPHYIPATDVVPKSACDECAEKTRNTIVKLQCQINRLKKYDEERDIALHARLVAETREKVAREIFEEIEKALILSKCYGDSGVYFEHDIETDIAELKKKYIPEEAEKTEAEEEKFFTPEDVRKMSAAEVRANYTKIINSMSKWH